MMQHLLLVSLGPIQDFIASARRCQDLWFGSWLLSDLARATAQGIASASGSEALIFPGSLELTDDGKPAVANKILCVVDAGGSPQEVAAEGKASMDGELERVAAYAFDRVAVREKGRGFYRDTALAQVRDLIEYVWASVAFEGTATYASARDRVEALLSARKNTKTWGSAAGWAAAVPKSSLDGLRESVLDESLFDAVQQGKRSAEWLRTNYFVAKSERLCGVGLLKRIGSELPPEDEAPFFQRRRPVFHSTSHVATGPLRTRVARLGDRGEQAVAGYFDALRAVGVKLSAAGVSVRGAARSADAIRSPFQEADEAGAGIVATSPAFATRGGTGTDGRVFFESRLTELLEEFCPEPWTEATVAELGRALRGCLKALGTGPEPPPYYGVLLADGDNMGKCLERLGRERGIEGHRELARALDGFSIRCKAVVERLSGNLVYAGGDDVLALVPLHTALACASELRREFRERLSSFDPTDDAVPKPTLSVGLAIVHHMEDMAEARALAKQAEACAKGVVGKNALAVLVQKRSGGLLQAVGSWEGDGDLPPLAQRIDRHCTHLRGEQLPDKVAFDLETALLPLVRSGAGVASDALVESLARRVLQRKRGRAASVDRALALLLPMLRGKANVESAVMELSQELQIARTFLDAYETAFGALATQGSDTQQREGAGA